jgi:hypothetical protein
VWGDQAGRTASIQKYYQIFDAFAASSGYLDAPLKHQAFPLGNPLGRPQLDQLEFWRLIELTSFYVPRGVLDRQLFEQAYSNFRRFVDIISFSTLQD